MKKRFLSFAMGALVALLIGSTTITALAASGAITIEVSPISVLVDGEVFQPKDAKGNDVMVFTYNGTTYAPLRALAEAYGLEVGYDGERHIATVNSRPTQTQPPSQTPTMPVLIGSGRSRKSPSPTTATRKSLP